MKKFRWANGQKPKIIIKDSENLKFTLKDSLVDIFRKLINLSEDQEKAENDNKILQQHLLNYINANNTADSENNSKIDDVFDSAWDISGTTSESIANSISNHFVNNLDEHPWKMSNETDISQQIESIELWFDSLSHPDKENILEQANDLLDSADNFDIQQIYEIFEEKSKLLPHLIDDKGRIGGFEVSDIDSFDNTPDNFDGPDDDGPDDGGPQVQ